MGIELHAVAETSELTKGDADTLVKILKAKGGIADAQLHDTHYENPVMDAEERRGTLRDKRRVSVFVTADTAGVARQVLRDVQAKYSLGISRTHVFDGKVYCAVDR